MQVHRIRSQWVVSRVGGGALTNERAANITGANPCRINPWFVMGHATARVSALNGATFTGVRIYGAHNSLGFPVPGAAAECIAEFGTLGGTANTGLIRQLKSTTIPAGVAVRFDVLLSPIPPFLLLEYDMAAGGGGTSTMTVSLSLWGFEVSGTEA